MARRPAPTKANLFKAQKDLRFAEDGCELLHQKRDVLVMELMGVASRFSPAEEGLRESLLGAMEAFVPAYVAMGRASAGPLLSGGREEFQLRVEERAVMGLTLPRVAVGDVAGPGFRGAATVPASADIAARRMSDAAARLAGYVEVIATVWRLASEIEKTQKRINALENMFIPSTRDTIGWIKSVMEENDREELFRRKLLKNRTQETGGSRGEDAVPDDTSGR
ncbi:MAG: V-type ATP synthase subunit D [Lentisphaerae bacterium]|nr:V-type ATP synthase subunit D [Lentisphaerota bacterium]